MVNSNMTVGSQPKLPGNGIVHSDHSERLSGKLLKEYLKFNFNHVGMYVYAFLSIATIIQSSICVKFKSNWNLVYWQTGIRSVVHGRWSITYRYTYIIRNTSLLCRNRQWNQHWNRHAPALLHNTVMNTWKSGTIPVTLRKQETTLGLCLPFIFTGCLAKVQKRETHGANKQAHSILNMNDLLVCNYCVLG